MHNRGTTEADELARFMREATHHLESKQRRITHLLSNHDRWTLDRKNAVLSMHARTLPLLYTRVVFVGHHDPATSTFRWGWSVEGTPEQLVAPLEDVRAVGESRGFAQLTRAEWKASEADGWNMSAVTALVLDGRGAYRVPEGGREAFYVLLDPLTFESLPPAASGEW